MTEDEVDEDTESPDIKAAQAAIVAAKTSARRTERLVDEANNQLMKLVAWRQENHFTEKIRGIIQGAAR